MGGTLANLRGYIESNGGRVLGAVALTGKPYSAKLTLEEKTLEELRQTHGQNLDRWWQNRFGHAFDRLTQSEARYLARSPDADTIRDRIAAAEQAGDRGSKGGANRLAGAPSATLEPPGRCHRPDRGSGYPGFLTVRMEESRTSWHNMFWINRLCRHTRTAL